MRDPVRARPAIVGHRGAPGLAPDNTLAGFEAAIAHGADAIELDVRRDGAGLLVVAHRRRSARRGQPLRFDEALEFIANRTRAEIGLLVDVKEPGIERDVAAAVGAAGLGARTVACAREVSVLCALEGSEPALRRAWSLKRPRHAAAARLGPPHRDVPAAVGVVLRRGLAGAVSVHRSLATGALVETAHEAGGEVYVWGIDRLAQARRLVALDVDALVVDDPRAYHDLVGARAPATRQPGAQESPSSAPSGRPPGPRRSARRRDRSP
jgi:glycerophosphoryl diester phosphodiesterase